MGTATTTVTVTASVTVAAVPCIVLPSVDLNRTGFVGSPSYIAPEVLRESARYDERADVYSFGILTWFVSQHEYMTYNPDVYSSKAEHQRLMIPYKKGASRRHASHPCPHSSFPIS